MPVTIRRTANAGRFGCVHDNVKNSWTGGEALRPDPTDEHLALAVHRREPGAFDRLVEAHEPSLFNFAHRLLQNPFDAQEVVQDTFMRAHHALTEQYSEERSRELLLRPWLFRIARNLCYNRRRGKSAQLEQPLTAFDDNRLGPLIPGNTAPADIQKREEAAELDRAIALLPTESRELIVLRFMEEMPYAEISKTTGMNESVLRGKVFRSLKLLREALTKKGVVHGM